MRDILRDTLRISHNPRQSDDEIADRRIERQAFVMPAPLVLDVCNSFAFIY